MDKGIEALNPVCVPKRIVRNWSTSVMRHCDYCSHYKDTVLNDDGSAICASCCDSEHSGNLQCALEEALQRNGVLIAALEQAQQEYQTIEQKLINAAVYIEILKSEPRKTNLKQLNEIAGLKRKCAAFESGEYGFFAYWPQHGEELFKKREDAVEFCNEAIEDYRRENAEEGCDENEVRRVCWGVVMQAGIDVASDDEGHIDYALTPVLGAVEGGK